MSARDQAASPSDAELLEAWREGDAKAGGQLFERYFETVYRFFHTKVADRADDLVQQTFLACVRSREQVRSGASFRSYLLVTARRKLMDSFRRAHSRRVAADDVGEMSLEELGVSPSSFVGAKEEERLVIAAMRKLPLQLQIVMELYHYEGLRGEELNAALELPPGTIRSRLRRGLELLRKHVERLARSPQLAESTITSLEAWSASIRRQALEAAERADLAATGQSSSQ